MRSRGCKAGAGRGLSRERRNQNIDQERGLKAILLSELLLHAVSAGGEGGVGVMAVLWEGAEYSTYK